MDLDIETLMRSFLDLGYAEIGNGPKHPAAPNPDLAAPVQAFLARFPILRRDQGYVDFLEYYAGASILWPHNDLVVDIFGFTEVSSHLLETDGPIVDEHGYFWFCSEVIRLHPGFETRTTTAGLQFAFDTTQQRRWGIYRGIDNEDSSRTEFAWYCESFLEWLNLLIENKGRLL
jgi:hypothetical protein